MTSDGLNLRTLTAGDKIYGQPGALLEFVNWGKNNNTTLVPQGVSPRPFRPPLISFTVMPPGRLVEPKTGDVMMVVSQPKLIRHQISVELLWNGKTVTAVWDYRSHGFMQFFSLKYNPTK